MDCVASILKLHYHALLATLGQQQQQQQQQEQEQSNNSHPEAPDSTVAGATDTPLIPPGTHIHLAIVGPTGGANIPLKIACLATNHDERATFTSKRGGSTRNMMVWGCRIVKVASCRTKQKTNLHTK